MDFITTLVSTPSGFWANIINSVEDLVLNYAWAIILITIAIRLILVPLDFYRQYATRNNMRAQASLAPQLQNLQKKYGNDKTTLNQKTMELYRANNFNVAGLCLPMLLYMGITLVIFFTLFASLNAMSAYKIEEQYLTLKSEYEYVIDNGGSTSEAEDAVAVKYDEIKNSFIWVNNVWVADAPWKNSILSFDEYLTSLGQNIRTDITQTDSVKFSDLSETEQQDFENDYNAVMSKLLTEKNGPNGYLITALVAVAICFLAQYTSQRRLQAKNSVNGQTAQSTNKALLVIMPLIMGVFTLFYNAVFGLYLAASQIVAIFAMPIIDKILDKIYAKKDAENAEKNRVDYRR